MITFNQIPISDVLARTKVQLRIDNTTEHDDMITMFIKEGLFRLDSFSLYKKEQCVLDIVDNKAKLPNNFANLLAMWFSGEVTQNQFINGTTQKITIPVNSPLFYVNTKFIKSCGITNDCQNYTQSAQINNGYIHINSGNIDSGKISLAYLAFNLDENGDLLIYDSYEVALFNYACYNYITAFSDSKKINLADVYYRQWVAQKNWIKANAFNDEFKRNKMEIASSINALVSDKTVTWNIR